MKIGFYGTGNMGKAIINGIINAKIALAQDIYISDLNKELVNQLIEELNVVEKDQSNIAKEVDVLILAVKPNIIPIVLEANKASLNNNTIIVSIAAGVSIKSIEDIVGDKQPIVRIMPNTPALVNEGMSALCFNESISSSQQEQVISIFNSFGKAEVVAENLIDAVVGVSGSAPAYVYIFIEALADGAVLCGMPRAQAYEFAAQTVLGSAKMVLETGMHP
ncbi:MAG: pyrroline-5-carboxylate reductase, partial [Erysipelotrichales bacterium]